jgi:hypothetical protein
MEAGIVANGMVRRSAGPALRQPIDPLVELRIALEADGVVLACGLQHVEQGRNGEGGIHTETPTGTGMLPERVG